METLAALEHERWSRWQRYLHSRCEARGDGTLVIPADLVARWEDQSVRPYDALTEAEKESDREQVRQYLPAIAAALRVGETG
jgi:hypothetical protein